MEQIGTRLKKLREDKGLSVEGLKLSLDARKELNFSVSRETLDKWERGTRVPNAEAIVSLALYYGVSADYILGLEEYWATHDSMEITAVTLGVSNKATENLVSLRNHHADVLNDLLESPNLEKIFEILKKTKSGIERQLVYCEGYKEKYDVNVTKHYYDISVDLSDIYIVKAVRRIDTLLRESFGFNKILSYQDEVAQHGEHQED